MTSYIPQAWPKIMAQMFWNKQCQCKHIAVQPCNGPKKSLVHFFFFNINHKLRLNQKENRNFSSSTLFLVSCFIDGLGGSLHAFLHSGICGSSISPVDRILLRTEFSAIFITFFLNIPWFCFLQTVFHLVPVVATLKVTSVSKGYKLYIFDLEILPGLHWEQGWCPMFCQNLPQYPAHAVAHSRWFILSAAVWLPGSGCGKSWLAKWVDWDRICQDRQDPSLDLFHTEVELEQSPVLTNNEINNCHSGWGFGTKQIIWINNHKKKILPESKLTLPAAENAVGTITWHYKLRSAESLLVDTLVS